MNALSLSPAEREHLEHVAGEATEYQNCYTEAQQKRAELASAGSVNIRRMHKLRLFVLAQEIEYYCRATDAFVGTYHVAISGFPTRAGAEQALSKLYDAEDEGRAESMFVVLPPPGC